MLVVDVENAIFGIYEYAVFIDCEGRSDFCFRITENSMTLVVMRKDGGVKRIVIKKERLKRILIMACFPAFDTDIISRMLKDHCEDE